MNLLNLLTPTPRFRRVPHKLCLHNRLVPVASFSPAPRRNRDVFVFLRFLRAPPYARACTSRRGYKKRNKSKSPLSLHIYVVLKDLRIGLLVPFLSFLRAGSRWSDVVCGYWSSFCAFRVKKSVKKSAGSISGATVSVAGAWYSEHVPCKLIIDRNRQRRLRFDLMDPGAGPVAPRSHLKVVPWPK